MKQECLKIRAHHGMCLHFFEGKGYSNEFTAHLQKIYERMQKNPEVELVVCGDEICKKCPNLENGICRTQELVLYYDKEVLKRCGLSEKTKIFWNDFSKLVQEKIIFSGERQNICGNCQWSCICEKKVEKNLLETEKNCVTL